MAGGDEGGQEQPQHPFGHLLSAHRYGAGVHMQGYVAHRHQARGLERPGLAVRAGAGAIGVEGLAVAPGTEADQVAPDEAQIVA